MTAAEVTKTLPSTRKRLGTSQDRPWPSTTEAYGLSPMRQVPSRCQPEGRRGLSAMVEVAQLLLGRGYKVRIFDPQLNLARLVGSNKRLIDTKMPHLASLLHDDLARAIGQRGLIVAAQRCASIAELAKVVTPGHRILDVNGWPELGGLGAKYEGFCW